MPTCSESQWLPIQARLNRTRSDHSHHPDCSRICHWYNLEKRAILGKLNSHLIRTLLSLHASCSCDWSNTLKPLYIKKFFPLYRPIICVGATDVSFIQQTTCISFFSIHFPLTRKLIWHPHYVQEWSKQNFTSINSGWLAALAFVLKKCCLFFVGQ